MCVGGVCEGGRFEGILAPCSGLLRRSAQLLRSLRGFRLNPGVCLSYVMKAVVSSQPGWKVKVEALS